MTDLVLGRPNPWTSMYDPARKVIHGFTEFVTEQANKLSQYTDWVKGGKVGSTSDIGEGEGAIVQDDVVKLAVCHDFEGELHILSVGCIHL